MKTFEFLLYPALLTGEGQKFEQQNFRITDISNLKINERANVERPNLQESLQ